MEGTALEVPYAPSTSLLSRQADSSNALHQAPKIPLVVGSIDQFKLSSCSTFVSAARLVRKAAFNSRYSRSSVM